MEVTVCAACLQPHMACWPSKARPIFAAFCICAKSCAPHKVKVTRVERVRR